MATNDALKCVRPNRLLQKIMQNQKLFGDMTLLLGGYFRRTLPVVPHGRRSDIVEASIKFHHNWKSFKLLELKSNVRSVDTLFSEWLLKIGDGSLTNMHGLPDYIIEIPSEMIFKDNGTEKTPCESLIREIFGNKLCSGDVSKFCKRCNPLPKKRSC
jgi:PIF1-like helicase